ncbi:hypothetical protein [Aliarcobacter cryaerophilus]
MYAKPNFINEVKENGIDVIARLSKSNRIWQFTTYTVENFQKI